MISFRQKGNFASITERLKRLKDVTNNRNLDRYGQEGVNALASATPVKTGKTANSWYYEIVHTKESVTIQYKNSNIQNGVPIAVIIQYGHGTGTGGWVQGRDYINPAIRPVFDKIVNDVRREVTGR